MVMQHMSLESEGTRFPNKLHGNVLRMIWRVFCPSSVDSKIKILEIENKGQLTNPGLPGKCMSITFVDCVALLMLYIFLLICRS